MITSTEESKHHARLTTIFIVAQTLFLEVNSATDACSAPRRTRTYNPLIKSQWAPISAYKSGDFAQPGTPNHSAQSRGCNYLRGATNDVVDTCYADGRAVNRIHGHVPGACPSPSNLPFDEADCGRAVRGSRPGQIRPAHASLDLGLVAAQARAVRHDPGRPPQEFAGPVQLCRGAWVPQRLAFCARPETQAGVPYSIEAHKGAALLDKVGPGWFKRIDLDRLFMRSAYQCVLGQLSGNYNLGRIQLKTVVPLSHQPLCSFSLGFNIDGQPTETQWNLLTLAWRREIETRLVAQRI